MIKSIIGSIFYCRLYAGPIANIARKHGLRVHAYADDTQLYLPFDLNKPNSEESARQCAEACISEIKSWMTINKLKLNDDKTEFLIITPKHQRHKIINHNIHVDSASIHASPCARNLGVIFDNTLSMDKHVSRICQSTYYYLRTVNTIRKTLSHKTAATIIHSLVTSRLDNGNSLLYGVTEHQLHKLQLLQNAAARVLTKSKKHDHITPILQELHWLPIRQRIQFKILLIAFKSQFGLTPSYIANLLVPYAPSRTLRSSAKSLLTIPRTSSSYYGDRSFSACAPKLWNALPNNIRRCSSLPLFKNLLKTHLFKSSYT
jgi:hypothetical protein